MLLPLVLGEQDWPETHAGLVTQWRSALAELGRTWDLDGEWERLPLGEDSVVFAQRSASPPWIRAARVARRRRAALPVA